MSLQDDYFDLHSELTGSAREALERIWDAFCDYEKENDRLAPIVANTQRAIEGMFDVKQ